MALPLHNVRFLCDFKRLLIRSTAVTVSFSLCSCSRYCWSHSYFFAFAGRAVPVAPAALVVSAGSALSANSSDRFLRTDSSHLCR